MNDLLSHIGHTAMVRLEGLTGDGDAAEIYAKLEGDNPGGSIKDRIALYMIEDAEKSGALDGGKKLLEATSGNTGIGLAMVAALKGYQLRIIMPESMSLERRRTVQAYGAEVILSDAAEGMNGAIEAAHRLAGEGGYCLVDQFANPGNVRAHYETTGPEIVADMKDGLDAFVAGIGTGGTLTGTGRRLREAFPDISIIGVEPHRNSKIQGLRNLEDYMPPIMDLSVLTEKVRAEDDDAFTMSRRLARECGLLVGISAGASVHAAVRLAKEMGGGRMVVIIPDRGDKYLSTDLFPRCNCPKYPCDKLA